MKTIVLLPLVGGFAENKDIARDIRLREIMPALKKGETLVLDFEGVTGATQSFIHSLLSDVIREFGPQILESIDFKSCVPHVKEIIEIVVDYMQVVVE